MPTENNSYYAPRGAIEIKALRLNMNCAICDSNPFVLVKTDRYQPSGSSVHATYFRCERCAQVQIVGEMRYSTSDGARPIFEHFDEILEMAISDLGASKGNIQVLDPDRQTLLIASQRGFEKEFLDFFHEVSVSDNCACGLALKEQKRIIIEDVEADNLFALMRPTARSAGFRAVQSTPIVGRDNKPMGMLSTHFSSPHRPSENEFKRLASLVEELVEIAEQARPR